MKKKILFLVVIILTTCMVACGEDSEKINNNSENSTEEKQQLTLKGRNDYLLVDSKEEKGLANHTGIFVNDSGNVIELHNSDVDSVRGGIVAYEDDKGKLALRNIETGKEIVNEYSSYEWLVSAGSLDTYAGLADYLVVKNDDKYGVIDVEGNLVIECLYKDISCWGEYDNPTISCYLDTDNKVDYNADFEKISLEESEDAEVVTVFDEAIKISDMGKILKITNEATGKYVYKSAKTEEVLFEESDNMYNITIKNGVVFYNNADNRRCFGILSDDCSSFKDIGFVQDLQESFENVDFSSLKSEISCATDGKRAFTFYDSKSGYDHLFVYTVDGEVDAIVPYIEKVWAYNSQIYFMQYKNGNKLQEELVIGNADGYITSIAEYIVVDDYDFFAEKNYIELKSGATQNYVLYDLESQKEVVSDIINWGFLNSYYLLDGSKVQYYESEIYDVKDNETIKKITDKYRVSSFDGDKDELVIMDLHCNELSTFVEDDVLDVYYYFGVLRTKAAYYGFDGSVIYEEEK